jgi:unsaturated rhamnogalacturonyl hydrolase
MESKGKTVLLDVYFNNEWRKDNNGQLIRYHYTWDDQLNTGFSDFGSIFHKYGARTDYLTVAPTARNLKDAKIYMIVDPDTEAETREPHYMTAAAADEIANWVKRGGTLLLMGNDSANAELKNFNLLASKFGVRFNLDDFNGDKGSDFSQASVIVPIGHPLFKTASKLYIKDLSTLNVSKPARTILSKDGKSIMAIARYGKGAVLVIGDPWLYNEYTDGKKLPPDFTNHQAGEDLVRWLLNDHKW